MMITLGNHLGPILKSKGKYIIRYRINIFHTFWSWTLPCHMFMPHQPTTDNFNHKYALASIALGL